MTLKVSALCCVEGDAQPAFPDPEPIFLRIQGPILLLSEQKVLSNHAGTSPCTTWWSPSQPHPGDGLMPKGVTFHDAPLSCPPS